MNGRADHEEQEGVGEEAAGWVLRLESPEATEADWRAAQAWLDAAPEHRAAFDRSERVSAELSAGAADLLQALRERPPIVPSPRRASSRRAGAMRRVWPAAAGLAAAAAAVAVAVMIRPEPVVPTESFQTAKGESRLLDLADGSHVRLNSASRLSVRLERKARRLELAEGEAAFDVAKDPARPFLVGVGEREIRVVGTEFDILRHDGRLRVTVRRGVVAVQAAEDSPQGALSGQPVLLHVGDQYEREPGQAVAVIQKVDPDAAFAWRDGQLIYRDQPLAEVVEDLNRYYATPVRVDGPAADLRFSGVIKMDAEADVVRRLQGFLHLAADRDAGGYTLRQE